MLLYLEIEVKVEELDIHDQWNLKPKISFNAENFFAPPPRDDGPDRDSNKIFVISDRKNPKLSFSPK